MIPFTPEQLAQLQQTNPEWQQLDNHLVRTYRFPDFLQAIAFVSRVAALAEASAHHPDIDIRYNRVRLALTTHDANGISSRDANFIASMSTWPEHLSGEKRDTPSPEI